MRIDEKLKEKKLLFDGAFGTYYAEQYDTKALPEVANTAHPERVLDVHRDYIRAGAEVIRTNTFATNTVSLGISIEKVKENLRRAYQLAKRAAQESGAYVAADIGPIPCVNQASRESAVAEYIEICRTFLEEGAEVFVFETLSDFEDIQEAVRMIGDRAFVIVQFAVNQYGYTEMGLSARSLLRRAEQTEYVDAVGLNCNVGPGHMQRVIQGCGFRGEKYRTALPNSGYPQYAESRMIFDHDNIDYFAEKMGDILQEGADLVGGCCGTTPKYIQKMHDTLCFDQVKRERIAVNTEVKTVPKASSAFYAHKRKKKIIAVELAPPLGSDDSKLMDAAHLLKRSGADVLTFPDSPSGRTRADSILTAEKVTSETGLCVMPHLCCRDKNAIGIRSQILGAYINGMRNFLVVTGDPVPSAVRGRDKNVFHFDAVGLMRIMQEMCEEQFAGAEICYGGAINQGRRNLSVEIERVKKKMQVGASFFMTQPVLSAESADRLRRIKQETDARILCGIMPFVNLKNAVFMKNEMTGIDVNDAVLARFRPDMTREEGEAAGIALAKEMIALTEDFADGYYFSFPFHRVHMLSQIIDQDGAVVGDREETR